VDKSVLFIAYDYPPILSPESIQIQRRALALAEEGVKVFVLTAHQSPLFETLDPSLVATHPNITIVSALRPCFEKLLNIVCKVAEITDRKFWWQFYALPVAKKLIETEQIGVIYSHATPLVDHLIGLKLKTAFPALRWIAHFSDPWTLNPYITYRTRWQLRLNRKLEARVLQTADAVTVTSERTKTLFAAHFPIEAKISVLPHVFDPGLYASAKPNSGNKTVIVHTGNIYGLRSIAPLLEALNRTKPTDQEFHFYGRIKPSEACMVQELGLEDCVKIFPQIPYLESIRVINEADMLLVVDAPLENSPFFPSKLADYIGAGKPIIALTPSDSATADILHTIGNDKLIASSDSLEGINALLPKISRNKETRTYRHIEAFDMTRSFPHIKKVFFAD
jgi:hypothetical protein